MNQVFGEAGESDLRLQDVLLRNFADRVLDPGRIYRLAGNRNVLIVNAKLVLCAQQIIKGPADLHAHL